MSDVYLYAGDATASDVILRAVPTAAAYAITGSGIITLSGSAELLEGRGIVGAGTIILSGSAGLLEGRGIVGAGVITLSGSADLLEGRGLLGAGTIPISGTAAMVYESATVDVPAPYVMPYTRNSDGPGITDRKPPPKAKEWPRVQRPLRHYACVGSGAITISGAAALAYTDNRPARDARDLKMAAQAANDARDVLAIVDYLRRAA